MSHTRTTFAYYYTLRMSESILMRLRQRVSVLAEYLGARSKGRRPGIADAAALEHFLETRVSHIAQSTLYGYFRTRAGTRFPVLFDDDGFVLALNHAKWQMWLACLSDLSIYSGGLLALRSQSDPAAAGRVVRRAVDTILDRTGTPDDSGPLFAEGAQEVRDRLTRCDWSALADDESEFTASPEALVRHAPIMPELMALDEEIVRNSVRFRWQEIRRELRAKLDADAVLGADRLTRPRTPASCLAGEGDAARRPAEPDSFHQLSIRSRREYNKRADRYGRRRYHGTARCRPDENDAVAARRRRRGGGGAHRVGERRALRRGESLLLSRRFAGAPQVSMQQDFTCHRRSVAWRQSTEIPQGDEGHVWRRWRWRRRRR